MSQTPRPLLKRIPVVSEIVRLLERRREAKRLRAKSVEEVFTGFFESGEWKAGESVSGIGSELECTRHLVDELPRLFRSVGVSTVLDIPCGDFHWMKQVDLEGVHYIGADIVSDLIAENTRTHGADTVTFQHLNLISDELPKVDLILCRDCLVHLCMADVFQALENMCRSGAAYVLMTTFPGAAVNKDIITGRWRMLDFEKPPFAFPSPLEMINERNEGEDGKFKEKSLGLWRLDAVQDAIRRT